MDGKSTTETAITEMVLVVRFLLGPDNSLPEFLVAAVDGLMAQLPSWCSGRHRTRPNISATESSMDDYAAVAAGKPWNPLDPAEGVFVVRWQLDSECANYFLNGGRAVSSIRSALVQAWRNTHRIESKDVDHSPSSADNLFYDVEDDDEYVDSGEDEKKSTASREITFTIETPNHVSFLAQEPHESSDQYDQANHHYHSSCSRQYQTMIRSEPEPEPADVDEIEEMLDEL